MLEYRLDNTNDIASNAMADMVDVPMIGRMRLVLAVAMLLTLYIEHSQLIVGSELAWIVFGAYIIHSIVLAVGSELRKRFSQGKLIHWLDVAWFALIVISTGGANSVFYLSFLFAILTSSFRWGLEEGARIAIASALLLLACGVASPVEVDLPRLLLRTVFLLSLGHMSAYWGESKVKLKRRLALLRDVSRLANPRFGVDQTVSAVMRNIQSFFNGSGCTLIMEQCDTQACTLRATGSDGSSDVAQARMAGIAVSFPLLTALDDRIVVYHRTESPWQARSGSCLTYENGTQKWTPQFQQEAWTAANLLDTHGFISAPLPLRNAHGRIFVTSEARTFTREDALFLSHVVGQAFPPIENIQLLDQIASHAATREREKIALDLHDAAVQPYIGLRLGLSAVRNKAAPDNPLLPDLDQLIGMSTEVIADLRCFTSTFEGGARNAEPTLHEILHRTAAQARKLYGLHVAVSMDGLSSVSDRLAVEVQHVVSEGLQNIRKHTCAQRGFIRLQSINGQLRIQIENEGGGNPFTTFTPRSILRRAAVLGGNAWVIPGSHGGAVVHVEIPT